MSDSDPGAADTEQLTELVSSLLPIVLRTIDALDQVQRHTHPGRFEQLAATLEPFREEMASAVKRFEQTTWPAQLDGFKQMLETAVREAHGGLERCALAHGAADPFVEWMRGMRGRSRSLEAMYPLSVAFSPVSRFFLESARRDDAEFNERLQAAMRDPRENADYQVGILNANNSRDERGGFSLYVPEYYDPSESWPLVVALHGGSGHGSDFLWTWLREARSRGFILLSPTSQGGTWSLMGDDVDAVPLSQMVEYVTTHWNVDGKRVLLTGMSDGGTYSSLVGLGADAPFTAVAPLCGIFHPMNAVNGNMEQVRTRPIYLLHGALDWMFPVQSAQAAYEQLLAAGANVTYREVPDLSHTYPRDENDAILRWFDPSLALPSREGHDAAGDNDPKGGE